MRFRLIVNLIIILIFQISEDLYSQKKFNFNNINQSNGLISKTIYSTLDESKGYLWFSSDKGVSRYDGSKFKHFTIDDGLTDNEVLKIYEDKKNRIWFLTYNGKPCYLKNDKIFNYNNDSTLNQFKNKQFFTEMSEHSNKIFFFSYLGNSYHILEDNKIKEIHLKSNSYFISKLEYKNKLFIVYNFKDLTGKWQYYLCDANNPNEIIDQFESEKYLYNFIVFKDQFYCINREPISRNEIWLLGPNKDFRHLTQSLTPIEINGVSNVIKVLTHENELVLCTNNGLHILNKNHQIESYLNNEFVTDFSTDFEGNHWASTKGNGIFSSFVLNYKFIDEVKENIHFIRFLNSNLNQYFAVGSKHVYFKSSKKTTKWQIPSSVGQNENITDLLPISENEFYFSNGIGLYHVKDKNFKIYSKLSGIKQIKIIGNKLLLARSNSIIQQNINELNNNLNESNYLYRGRCITLTTLDNGNLIFGTNNGAMIISNQNEIKKVDGIDYRIKKIIKTEENYILYCSDINGFYIQHKDEMIHLNNKNGLSSNIVNSAFKLKNSHFIWISTNDGISKYDIYKKTIENISILNTFDNNIFDLFTVNDTNFTLASNIGLISYEYGKTKHLNFPKLEIDYVKVNGKIIIGFNQIILNPNQNNIEIVLNGISFRNPNLEFHYSLNGGQWLTFNGSHLNLLNLNPGKYNIKIKCKNNTNQDSPIKDIYFEIKKPLLKQTWFISLIISLLLLLLIIYLRIKQKNENKKRDIELQMLELKHTALRAQLNPHFVFNSLNAIQYLYLSLDEENAIKYLNKFSILLRNILNHTESTFCTINFELDNLKLYLEIEQLRTKNNFEFEIVINDKIDQFSLTIPSMLIQPFVENSIWHGFENIDYIGKIVIEVTYKNPEYILILIKDNGKGIENSLKNKKIQKKSKGMTLINERLKNLSKLENKTYKLETISDHKGTIIILTIPVKF